MLLPGQKAKLLLVHHTVSCRVESAFLAYPVRNTVGSISLSQCSFQAVLWAGLKHLQGHCGAVPYYSWFWVPGVYTGKGSN